jgi:hypothetical protein
MSLLLKGIFMKALFVIFSLTGGFFFGALIGSATVYKAAGLAGGATVFIYGIAGIIIALILTLVFFNKMKPVLLKRITIILIILNIIYISWIIVRIQASLPEQEPQQKPPLEQTEPVITPVMFLLPQKNEQTEMGLGMAKPDFYNKRVLYFYSPNLEKSVLEHTPADSIVFTQTEHHHYDISYAPPWFYPEHLKMDYEILYMKVLTFSREWIEVEVNRETGLSSWISASDVEVLFWPEFLLTVFSIENLDPHENLLRIKPLSHASEFHIKEYEFLSPVMIKDSWIKVNLMDDDFNKVGEAWLQWHSDRKLLIDYSLLL